MGPRKELLITQNPREKNIAGNKNEIRKRETARVRDLRCEMWSKLGYLHLASPLIGKSEGKMFVYMTFLIWKGSVILDSLIWFRVSKKKDTQS